MIVVTILYPRTPSATFDFDYYLDTHMPRSLELLGSSMLSVSVERGIDPGAPWPAASFFAICRFVCDTRERFEAAFLLHARELQDDLPNYSDVTPIIQISDHHALR